MPKLQFKYFFWWRFIKFFCPACGTKIERKQSIQKTNSIVKHTNDDIDDILEIANQFILNNDYGNASKKYSDAINIEPNNCIALFGLYVCEMHRIEDLYVSGYYEASSINIKEIIHNIEEKYYDKACNNANDDKKIEFSQKRDELKKTLTVYHVKNKSNSNKDFNIIMFIILLILFWPLAILYYITSNR